MTLATRFWAKVDKTAACWLWRGALAGSGYGLIRNETQRMEGAHRVAYRLSKGDIPAGLLVLHTCDNKLCVNPAHLFAGTQCDNMHDMDRKGRRRNGFRQQKGAKNNNAKLTVDIVRKAKRLLACGVRQAVVMRKLRISRANVWCIAHGKSWVDA
jgi:hypothetical protein